VTSCSICTSAKPCDGGPITLAQQCERPCHIVSVTRGIARRGGYEAVPTLLQQQMAWIVVDAWMSNALCWLNRRATTGDINRRLWHLLAVIASRDGVQYRAGNPSSHGFNRTAHCRGRRCDPDGALRLTSICAGVAPSCGGRPA
jgi:hypothetical protein